ncbi:MAG: DNA mismatch repair endonuclease MutL, partial [Marinilabiliaceae bacterium]|nr:DNA mismatch repair endonuclease MutL [Marinilabiliaceae bacterium]
MPDIIKLLPDSVANQIAAGEVIQRPASLVKELIENSVDAGSSAIKIIIKDSGRTLVQVTDDGSGMSETDARLCFERHATSKINTAEDLFSINTKGFRGEALASIAAVAMVELKSRLHKAELGILISISGSKVEKQEPVSCPAGTNIAVKNLFFNVPARRKFLKSDATELRHIITEFERVAIAHPDIKFNLFHNDKELFNLPPSNQRQRIIGLFGKNINNALVNIDTESSLVRIKGFIGKPEFARKTFGEQYFFINRRYMRHPYFHKAVMEAYENILAPETIPSYFIFLETDPSSIDVNIHPTKTEIKFENERMIWQILHASIREAIGKFNISPSIDFETEGVIDIPVSGDFPLINPEIEVDQAFNPFSNEDIYQRPATRFDKNERANLTNWEKLYDGLESIEPNGDNKPLFAATGSGKFMQVKSKYILCQVKSGIMLIDQKRAHERILFDKFISMIGKDNSPSQKSLFPVTIELDQADIAILSELEDDLKSLGFETAYLGNNTVSINGYPSEAKNDDPSEMLEILLQEYKSTQQDPASERKEKIASSLARASAVPYGRHLSNDEMQELFDTLFASATPNYTPDGKAVVNIITLDEL